MRLTRDHTEVQKLIDEQKIGRIEARKHPRRNVLTSALGGAGKIHVDQIDFEVQEGDRFFVTSDGLHGKLLLRELLNLSLLSATPDEFVRRVMDEVDQRLPNDNFSVVCCFVD